MTTQMPERYSPASQSFHWLSALLVVLAWTLGIIGDELAKGGPRETGEFIHIVAGQAILALLLLRVVWRFVSPPPTASALGPFVDFAGRLMHIVLYALLIAVPVTGLVTLFQGGEALPLAGLYDIASPWPRNRELRHYAKEIHESLANALMLLAVIHAAAALAHHFLFKDNVLRRMLPRVAG